MQRFQILKALDWRSTSHGVINPHSAEPRQTGCKDQEELTMLQGRTRSRQAPKTFGFHPLPLLSRHQDLLGDGGGVRGMCNIFGVVTHGHSGAGALAASPRRVVRATLAAPVSVRCSAHHLLSGSSRRAGGTL